MLYRPMLPLRFSKCEGRLIINISLEYKGHIVDAFPEYGMCTCVNSLGMMSKKSLSGRKYSDPREHGRRE